MSTSFNVSSSGALPTISNTNQTGATLTNEQTSQAQNNTYSGAQSAAQNGVLSGIQALLAGQMPTNMGLSDAQRQAAWLDYNNNVAPQIAAQNGAGSPALGSSAAQFALGLAAQDGATGMANSLSAYNALGQYAFTPLGQSQTGTGQRLGQENTNQFSVGLDTGASLSSILDMLAGGSGATSGTTFPVYNPGTGIFGTP